MNQKKELFEVLKHKIKSLKKSDLNKNIKTKENKLQNKLHSVILNDLKEYISQLRIVKETLQHTTQTHNGNNLNQLGCLKGLIVQSNKITGERNEELVG